MVDLPPVSQRLWCPHGMVLYMLEMKVWGSRKRGKTPFSRAVEIYQNRAEEQLRIAVFGLAGYQKEMSKKTETAIRDQRWKEDIMLQTP